MIRPNDIQHKIKNLKSKTEGNSNTYSGWWNVTLEKTGISSGKIQSTDGDIRFASGSSLTASSSEKYDSYILFYNNKNKNKSTDRNNVANVTFDNDIKYYRTPLHSKLFSSKPIKYPMTIMEVKFHPEQLKTVSSSFKDFHLIPKRHSKYLVGISMLGNAIYL